jgi:Flp pilus assembly protein TadG
MKRLAAALASRWRVVTGTPDAGSSTAQVALLTPLLVMLLLFVVLCGRLAGAQINVDAAASSAARAGSISRSQAAAEQTARDDLTARGITCESTDISVSTGGLQPGGAVTVTVSCRVRLSDLSLLSVPGSRVVRASATSPIDQWVGAAP